MNVTPAQAAQACIDRFGGKTYEPGKRDCAILAAHLLHQYGVAVPVMKGMRYSTEAGAIKALKRTGCRDIIAGEKSTKFCHPSGSFQYDLADVWIERVGFIRLKVKSIPVSTGENQIHFF